MRATRPRIASIVGAPSGALFLNNFRIHGPRISGPQSPKTLLALSEAFLAPSEALPAPFKTLPALTEALPAPSETLPALPGAFWAADLTGTMTYRT